MPCNCENNVNQVYQTTVSECSYTKEQIEAWRDLVVCIKDNNHADMVGLTTHDINILMGTILSAVRIENPCLLKSNLDSIYSKIIQITSYNLC